MNYFSFTSVRKNFCLPDSYMSAVFSVYEQVTECGLAHKELDLRHAMSTASLQVIQTENCEEEVLTWKRLRWVIARLTQ